jgi:hypothetical protein
VLTLIYIISYDLHDLNYIQLRSMEADTHFLSSAIKIVYNKCAERRLRTGEVRNISDTKYMVGGVTRPQCLESFSAKVYLLLSCLKKAEYKQLVATT